MTKFPEFNCDIPTGFAATSDSCTAKFPVFAAIGGVAAEVLWAGLAPGFVGLYQVNVVVPSVEPGLAPVTLSVGNGAEFQNAKIPIAVQ